MSEPFFVHIYSDGGFLFQFQAPKEDEKALNGEAKTPVASYRVTIDALHKKEST